MAKICKTCGYANDNMAEVCVECSTPIAGSAAGDGMDLDFDSLLEELQTDEPAAKGNAASAGNDVLDIGVSDDDEASIFAELGIEMDSGGGNSGASLSMDDLGLDMGGDSDDIFAELGIETGDSGGDDIFSELGIDSGGGTDITPSSSDDFDLGDISLDDLVLEVEDDGGDPLAGLMENPAKPAPAASEDILDLDMDFGDLSLDDDDDPLAGLMEIPSAQTKSDGTGVAKPSHPSENVHELDMDMDLGMDLGDLSLDDDDDPLAGLMEVPSANKQTAGPGVGKPAHSTGNVLELELEDLGLDDGDPLADLMLDDFSDSPSTDDDDALTLDMGDMGDLGDLDGFGDLSDLSFGEDEISVAPSKDTKDEGAIEFDLSAMDLGEDELLKEIVGSAKEETKPEKDVVVLDVADFEDHGDMFKEDLTFQPEIIMPVDNLEIEEPGVLNLDLLGTGTTEVEEPEDDFEELLPPPKVAVQQPVVEPVSQPVVEPVVEPVEISQPMQFIDIQTETIAVDTTSEEINLDFTSALGQPDIVEVVDVAEPEEDGVSLAGMLPPQKEESVPVVSAVAKDTAPVHETAGSIFDDMEEDESEMQTPAISDEVLMETIDAVEHAMPEEEVETVGELIAKLGGAETDDERHPIIQKMGVLGDETAVPVLCEFLSYSNKDVRETVIESLGKIRSNQSVEPLIRTLTTEVDDIEICFLIAKVLGDIGNLQAEDTLIKLLKHKNEDLKYLACEALGKLRSIKAVTKLEKLLQTGSDDMRYIAARSLGLVGERTSIAHLTAALKDLEPHVRRAAVEGLGFTGDEMVADSIIPMLSDPDVSVRIQTCQTLGELKFEAAAAQIIRILDDPSDEIKRHAAIALGNIGEKDSAVALISLLSNENPEVVEAAVEAIGVIGNESLGVHLIDLLNHELETIRYKTVLALKELNAREEASAIIEKLQDRSERIRAEAAETLGRIEATDAVSALVVLLADPDETVRVKAVESLGKLHSVESIPNLIAVLRDSVETVAEKASWSLIEMGADATPFLLEKLDMYEEELKEEQALTEEIKVIRILGRLGDPRAIMPLLLKLENCGEKKKERVARALLDLDDFLRMHTEEDLTLKEAIALNRLAIVRGLVKVKHPGAIASMISIMRDSMTERDREGLAEYGEQATFMAEVIPSLRKNVAEIFEQMASSKAVVELKEAFRFAEPALREWIVYALGRIATPDAVAVLTGYLKTPADVPFRPVAMALRRIGAGASMVELQKLLTEDNSEVKIGVIFTIGMLADERGINAVKNMLADGEEEVRLHAVQALGRIGGRNIIAAVALALKDTSEVVRELAVTVLGNLRYPETIEHLSLMISDTAVTVRSSMVRGLSKITDDRVGMLLLRLTRDEAEEVRAAAVEAIGRIKYGQEIESVIELLDDVSALVRLKAAETLGILGNVQAVANLIAALSDEDSFVCNKAQGAIRLFAGAAIESLVDSLRNEDESIRDNGAAMLAKLKYTASIKPLVRCLKNRNHFMREKAAEVLGELQALEALDPLMLLIRDRNGTVRAAAVKSLGRIGDVRAITALKLAQFDQLRSIRKAAVESLERIHDKNPDIFLGF